MEELNTPTGISPHESYTLSTMKTLLTILLALHLIPCFAQLEGHILYKSVELSGQVHVQGNTGSLVIILGAFGSISTAPNDYASVVDLNYDGVINQADLNHLLGQWQNTEWELDPECSQSTYVCFLLDFPGQYVGTSWFPGQPFKMIQTTTTIFQWWWVEVQ